MPATGWCGARASGSASLQARGRCAHRAWRPPGAARRRAASGPASTRRWRPGCGCCSCSRASRARGQPHHPRRRGRRARTPLRPQLARGARSIVEYDGRHHVEREEQWEVDLARREEIDDHGWRILVVVAAGSTRDPGSTGRQGLARAPGRGGPGRARPARRRRWRPHFPGHASPPDRLGRSPTSPAWKCRPDRPPSALHFHAPAWKSVRSSTAPTAGRRQHLGCCAMDASHVENDLVNVLFTEEQIQAAAAARWRTRSPRTTRATTCSWSASSAAP